MTVLVTGATGLLGNNVVRLLLDRGRSVRVLVRAGGDPRPLQDLDVETVQGDVRDAEAARQACSGVSAVIHAAGCVQIGWHNWKLHRQVNVAGTRQIAASARQVGARLIHVSSINALGIGSWDKPASEDDVAGENVPCPYVVTKKEAEEVVRAEMDRGLWAVIVNPAFLLGPWDWKPSSGRMLLEVAQRFTPLAPTGGSSIGDVRDVAIGILTALERAQSGRQYILAGHNMSYLETWKLFAKVTGGRPPRGRLGPLIRVLAGAGGDLWSRVRGKEAAVNSAAIKMSGLPHFFSSQRAIDELGYQIRPVEESVTDAWEWFQQYGYVGSR